MANFTTQWKKAPLDSPATQFARGATLCMENLYHYFPEFSWLAEVIKMQWVARLLLLQMKGSAELLERVRSIFPTQAEKKLDHIRGQIREWPTNASRIYQDILNQLCANNPKFTRHQIETHRDAQTQLNRSSTLAREADADILKQIVQVLDDPAGSFNQSTLSGMVSRWLNTGDKSELKTLLSNHAIAPYERSHQALCREKSAIFQALGISPSPTSTRATDAKTQCCMVPAAIFHQEDDAQIRLTYGGVNLATNLTNGSISGQEQSQLQRMADAFQGCGASGGGNSGLCNEAVPNDIGKLSWVQQTDAATSAGSVLAFQSEYDSGVAHYFTSAGDASASYFHDVLHNSGVAGASAAMGADAAQPLSFSDLRSDDPSLANKFRNRGGYRNWAEAEQLYNKVPKGVRSEGAGAIRDFLSKVHASHIEAKAQGGTNAADNIVWEKGQNNLQRNYDFKAGRRETPHMEASELKAVDAQNRSIGLRATFGQMGKAAVGGAVVGAATNIVVSGLENAARFKNGEISGPEGVTQTLKEGVKSAAVGCAFAAGAVALTTLAPVLTPVVIVGGTALAGIGLIDAFQRVNAAAEELCCD